MCKYLLLLILLCAAPTALAKDHFADYPVRADSEKALSEVVRYFTQMGYAQDFTHTKQCDDLPGPGGVIFRQTGPAESGPSGLSRCVAIDYIEHGDVSVLRVEVVDHLRGGLSLPATAHYDAKFIHKNYDGAFSAIVKAAEEEAP
jgi:hypothetical protein